LKNLVNSGSIEKTIHDIIKNVKESCSVESGTGIRYPGENIVSQGRKQKEWYNL